MTQHHSRRTLQPAFVLHTRPYRNTSLLVDLFTAECGTVGAVARGARRRQSRLRGLMQPFRPLLVSWFGRGDLVTLTGAEDRGTPLWFTGHVLASAFYMNELLVRLLQRNDPHPALFRRYAETLEGLHALDGAAGGRGLQRILRLYEKYLLQELGYGPVLDREVRSGAPIEPARCYHYCHDRGPVAMAVDQVREAGAGRRGDGVAVTGRTLMGLARDVLEEPAVLREAKHLMRYLLEVHLGAKPLGSRTLIDIYGRGVSHARAPVPDTEQAS